MLVQNKIQLITKGDKKESKNVFSITKYKLPPQSNESVGAVKAGGIRKSITKTDATLSLNNKNKHPAKANFWHQRTKNGFFKLKELFIQLVFKQSAIKKVLIPRSIQVIVKKT